MGSYEDSRREMDDLRSGLNDARNARNAAQRSNSGGGGCIVLILFLVGTGLATCVPSIFL